MELVYDAFLNEDNLRRVYDTIKTDNPNVTATQFIELSGTALQTISQESDLYEVVSKKSHDDAIAFLNSVYTGTIRLLIRQLTDQKNAQTISDIYAQQVHDPSILINAESQLLKDNPGTLLTITPLHANTSTLKTPSDVIQHTREQVFDVIPPESRNNILHSKKIPIAYTINSRDRDTTVFPNSNSFTVNTKSAYRDITEIRLLRVTIPNLMYNVTSNYNVISFSETLGINLTATVPVGNYTNTTLPAAVKAALDLAGTSTYTVTIDPVNNRMSINSDLMGGGGIFQLHFFGGYTMKGRNVNVPTYPTNSAGQLFGYLPQEYSGGNTYISPGVVNLTMINTAYIYIDQANKINSTESPDSAFVSVPFNTIGLSGGVTVYTPIQKYIRHFSPSLPKWDRFSVSIRDYYGNLIDLNMGDFEMLVEFVALEDIDVKL